MGLTVEIVLATVALDEAVGDAPWTDIAAILSTDERTRAARFRFAADRHAYLAAHALVRVMLARATGRPARALRFATEPGGKPVLAEGGGPHFNLSHCTGLVTCAVSARVPVGVDAEPNDRPVAPELVARCLSPAEQASLRAQPAAAPAFARLWTCKEAFLKATGEGMARDLTSFAIRFGEGGAAYVDGAGQGGPWRLIEEGAGSRHHLALCWPGVDARIVRERLSLRALLS